MTDTGKILALMSSGLYGLKEATAMVVPKFSWAGRQCPECRTPLIEVELVPSGKRMLICNFDCGFESAPMSPRGEAHERH